jgi:hypothetical protein
MHSLSRNIIVGFLLAAAADEVACFSTSPAYNPLQASSTTRKSICLHAESPKISWDSFKGAVFKGMDVVKSVVSKVEKSDNDEDPEPFFAKSNVMDGYQDRFFQPEDEQKDYRSERVASLLMNNKMLTPKERAMYALKATAPGIIQVDQNPEVARPNLGPGPVRFKVDTKILEQEAFERAKKRGEPVRAKKEDLYNLVDNFKATAEAVPDTIRSVTNFVRSVPDRVEQTLSEVKAIPTKVQDSTTKTIQNTQKAVKDVQEFPNKVGDSVENTKKAFVDTKESLDRTVNKVKRFVGADTPAPEPPKIVPMAPKPPVVPPSEPAMKKAKKAADDEIFERVLDVTGRFTLASADLAFSATSSLASVAVDSAKKAITKAKIKKAVTPLAKVGYVAPAETKKDNTEKAQVERLQEEQRKQSMKNQKLNKESAKIEKEVADALKLAEKSLRNADKKNSS